MVFVNGLKLEDPTKELAEEQSRRRCRDRANWATRSITPGEYIYDFSFPKDGGKPNPHLWTDPPMAVRYAEIVRDTLSERDPGDADYFAANYDRVRRAGRRARHRDARVVRDHAPRRAQAADLPRRLRLLRRALRLGRHRRDPGSDLRGPDAEGGRRRSSARCAASRCRRSSAREVFPSPVLEQIGKEAGVTYVDVLRDDDLPGEPGDPEHSWLGLMRFDYVTMVEALGGDAVCAEGVRRPPRRARPRGVPAVSDARSSGSKASPARTRAAPVLARRRPRRSAPASSSASWVRPGRARRRCCASSRARSARRRAACRAAPRSAPRLRAAGRDGQLELPGHRRRVRAHGARQRPAAALGQSRPSAPAVSEVLDAPRHRRAGRPPHPRALGRPAAARVHRPRTARRAGPAADGRAHLGRRRPHAPRGAAPARRAQRATGLAIVLTTHDLNGVAAHLPWLVCLNSAVIGDGHARPTCSPPTSSSARTARRWTCSSTAGCRIVVDRVPPSGARRHSGGGEREMDGCCGRSSSSSSATALIVATMAGALCGLVGVYVVLQGHELHRARPLARHLRRAAPRARCCRVNFYLGAGVWGVASALMIGGVTRRRVIGADAAIGVDHHRVVRARPGAVRPCSAAAARARRGAVRQHPRRRRPPTSWAPSRSSPSRPALVVVLRYRALLFTTFDPEVAEASGVRTARVDALLMLVLAGCDPGHHEGARRDAHRGRSLVIPAVVARMLTNSFSRMLWLSTAIGAACGFVGMNLSYHLDVPSGPAIVLRRRRCSRWCSWSPAPRGDARSSPLGSPHAR